MRAIVVVHPWRVGRSVLLMLAVAVAEGATVSLLVPLLSIVGVGAPQNAQGSSRFQNLFAAFGHTVSLEAILVLAVAAVVLAFSLRLVERQYTRRFIGQQIVELRVALYDAYLRSSWPYWSDKSVGHAAGMLTVECHRALTGLVELMVFLSEIVLVVALVGVAFLLSWQVALLFVVIGAVAGLLLRRATLSGYDAGVAISGWNSTLNRVVQETLTAAKLVKASAMETPTVSRLVDVSDQLDRVEVRGAVIPFRVAAVFAPLVISLLCGGLYIALTVFRVNPASAIVLLFALHRASSRVIVAQRVWHMLVLDLAAYIGITNELREARAAAEHTRRTELVPCPRLERDIELRGVTFSHRPDMPLLSELSMRIPARTTVAIVGGSGAGKTTVLDLVLGLHEPQAGTITVDGVDLRRIDLHEWRNQIGYVGQEVVLFDDTIAANIRWARPEATDAEVVEAARLAHATQFIDSLPEGYSARVGDRGVRLSGGERQRLALARALIRRPSLLVLDEATSNLDALSERAIQDAIDALRSRMGILVIAHRLSTVRSADWIYVIEHGQVVQEGSWDSLIAASGAFSRMWVLQSQTEPTAVQ